MGISGGKTDIFKKLMWFSYPNDENWIAVDIARVKEIQKLNKEGIKPDSLKEEIAETDKVVSPKVFDYENVVGQDSLTRLDNKSGRNKKNNRKNRNKPKGQGTAAKPQQQVASGGTSRNTNENKPRPVQSGKPNVNQDTSNTERAERPARNNNRRKKNNRNNNNRDKPSAE